MSKSVQNLSNLLTRLLAENVDFVLVGGFAAVVHGSTMVTQDLDICLQIDQEQVNRLRVALKDLNPRHRMNPSFSPSFLDYPESFSDVNHIYLKTDLGILDILGTLPPIGDFLSVSSRAVQIDLYGHRCNVASLEDLIEIKKLMKRPKDIQMLAELERIKALRPSP